MIVGQIRIEKVYTNDGSNVVSIFGKPIDTDEFKIDPKYKTVKINGEFNVLYGEKNIVSDNIITVTTSDIPNASGYYKLLYPGMLPTQHILGDLNLFMKYMCTSVECESIKSLIRLNRRNKPEHPIKRLITDKSVSPLVIAIESYLSGFKMNYDIKRNLDNEIKNLRSIYQKNKDILAFTKHLADMGVTNEEEQLMILLAFKDKDLNKISTILKENPYMLVSETSMKLETIDAIALTMGIEPDDVKRVAAISEYNLRKVGATGKTWINLDSFVDMAISGNSEYSFYNLNTSQFKFEVNHLKKELLDIASNGLLWVDDSKQRIASYMYYEMEKELYNIILNLKNAENKSIITEKTIANAISRCEKRENIEYSQEQRESVFNSFRENLSIIAGAAGTGKSTIARAITEAYQGNITLATALAGKATLRLMETTGVEGRTMHSYLARLSGKYFEADLILIDEGSMLGLEIVLEFFRKIAPGTRVVILGDDSQLSPIGAGNVFSDLLNSEFIVKSHLKTVRRQALESNIIKFATMVRNQKVIDSENNPFKETSDDFKLLLKESDTGISRAVTNEFKSFISKYDLKEIMIVTPYKIKGTVNTFDINNRMQKILLGLDKLNPKNYKWLSLEEDKEKKFVIYEGDRVINIQNNYNCKDDRGEKTPVMNGSLGTVLRIEKHKAIIDFDGIGVVEFTNYDLKNILLGYAISTHKSQGSQAKAVIYTLAKDVGRLGCCEQVYTGVTRAKDIAVVIACLDSLNQCIETKELNSKQTLLREFLDSLVSQNNSINNELSDFAKKYGPKKKKKESKNDEKLPEIEVNAEVHEDYKIDDKLREVYDRNNIRRKLIRRNDSLLSEREQTKVDKMRIVQDLYYNCGRKNKEIVDITGLGKGTVSKYIKIDIDDYIEDCIKRAGLKKD